MKSTLITLLAVSLCLPALAGDEDRKRAERAAELQRMREKEARRANESAEYAGNMEHLEKRYGWAKEDMRDQYNDLAEKRKIAARAWKEAAKRLSHADNYDQVHEIKIPAYHAGAVAQLAELELKSAGSERYWSRTAEKADSEAAKQVARRLIDNQKKIVEATKEKLIREHQLRELAQERNELEQELNEQVEKARRKEHEGRDRKPERRPERKPDRKPEPRPEPERRDPPKINIE